MDQGRTLNLVSYGLQEVAEEEEEIEEDVGNDSMSLSSAPENETSECSSSPATYPPIPPRPKTPRESMEFLCRSWSMSTSEISLTLSSQKSNKQLNKNHTLSQLAGVNSTAPAPLPPPLLVGKPASGLHARRTGAIGKWFHRREFVGGRVSGVRKRDKARVENAHIHTAVSIASLATAIAAVIASGNQDGDFTNAKMSSALASASELLASHCVELAELSGACHDRIVSAVRSAADVRGPETHDCASKTTDEQIAALGVEESKLACTGELMQCTRNGVILVVFSLQIVVETKSKHVRGAFSMKSKGIVNDVCETVAGLQNGKETENAEEELYFGISTGKGLAKFRCKSKADKQTWVDGIRNLLHRVTAVESIKTSLETKE